MQGERPLARDNKHLGTFHLDGIPPAPRGVPQIEVTFDIDANGILHVSREGSWAPARNKRFPSPAAPGLTKEEVEKMQRDAEAHAEEDKKAKEAIEIKNNADKPRLSVREAAQGSRRQDLVATRKSPVEDAIAAVREAINGNDTDAMKKDLRRLAEQVPGGQRRALQASRSAGWSAAGPQPGPRSADQAARRRGRKQGQRRCRRRGVRSRRRGQEKELNKPFNNRPGPAYAEAGITKNQPTAINTPTPMANVT